VVLLLLPLLHLALLLLLLLMVVMMEVVVMWRTVAGVAVRGRQHPYRTAVKGAGRAGADVASGAAAAGV
jgi:hypothetical protein